MKNVLLTGATGFLGRAVLKELAGLSCRVIAFGRNQPSFNGSLEIKAVNGDLATGEGLEELPWNDVDQVIHLAAAGVKASRRRWDEAIAVNILGTQRLLQFIKEKASRRPAVFLAGTFYEHVLHAAPSLRENPYVMTKAAAAQTARWWSEQYEGGLLLGSIFQLYGPGDDPGAVLSYAARSIKAGNTCVLGSGRGERDWLYVSDAASAIIAALNAARPGAIECDIGSGTLRSLREVVVELLSIAHADPALVVFDPTRDRDDTMVREYAQRMPIGWSPRTSLAEGLTQLFQNS